MPRSGKRKSENILREKSFKKDKKTVLRSRSKSMDATIASVATTNKINTRTKPVYDQLDKEKTKGKTTDKRLVVVKNRPNALKKKINCQKTSLNSQVQKGQQVDLENTNAVSRILDDGVQIHVDDSEFSVPPNNEDEHSQTEDSDVDLGGTASTLSKADKAKKLLGQHPELKHLFNQMLNEKIDEVKRICKNNETPQPSTSGGASGGIGNRGNDINLSPVNGNNNRAKLVNRIVKSPSDTTLYRPVFQRDINETINDQEPQIQNKGKEQQHQTVNDVNIIEKISNFVEAIRMENDESTDRQEDEEMDVEVTPVQQKSTVNVPGMDSARDKSERSVLEAEKFKATVANPPGMESDLLQQLGCNS